MVSVPSSWTSHRGESVNSNLISAGLPIWAKLGKTLGGGRGRGREGRPFPFNSREFRWPPRLLASSPATLWSLRVVDRRDSSTRVVSFRCRNPPLLNSLSNAWMQAPRERDFRMISRLVIAERARFPGRAFYQERRNGGYVRRVWDPILQQLAKLFVQFVAVFCTSMSRVYCQILK